MSLNAACTHGLPLVHHTHHADTRTIGWKLLLTARSAWSSRTKLRCTPHAGTAAAAQLYKRLTAAPRCSYARATLIIPSSSTSLRHRLLPPPPPPLPPPHHHLILTPPLPLPLMPGYPPLHSRRDLCHNQIQAPQPRHHRVRHARRPSRPHLPSRARCKRHHHAWRCRVALPYRRQRNTTPAGDGIGNCGAAAGKRAAVLLQCLLWVS